MRIETVPLIVGVLVALLGVALIYDAWTPDQMIDGPERRRATRLERHRGGEASVGVGVLCMGAAFMGRDVWSYRIVAAILGAALLLVGIVLDRRHLVAMIGNRGPMRRSAAADTTGRPDPKDRLR